MGGALETLCGQAYGAKQYYMLGIHTQRAMLILFLLSIPISLFYLFTCPILISLVQDLEISAKAGAFNRWMVPCLFAFSLLQSLNRFFQAQNDVLPMMVSSVATASLHVLVCWVLVFSCRLRIRGAAVANSISYRVNVSLLAGSVNFSPAYLKNWTGFLREALHDVLSFGRCYNLLTAITREGSWFSHLALDNFVGREDTAHISLQLRVLVI